MTLNLALLNFISRTKEGVDDVNMDNFDDFDNPLDILDDDGDDAVEMCLFFDEDGKSKGGGNQPSNNSGCSIGLLVLGASFTVLGISIAKFIT